MTKLNLPNNPVVDINKLVNHTHFKIGTKQGLNNYAKCS